MLVFVYLNCFSEFCYVTTRSQSLLSNPKTKMALKTKSVRFVLFCFVFSTYLVAKSDLAKAA